ncbi:unnamed protein product, partial [Nesidiocoris tenuis]
MKVGNGPVVFWRTQITTTTGSGTISTNTHSRYEPEFVEPLYNLTVPVGREAAFSCVVSHLGGYRLLFFENHPAAHLKNEMSQHHECYAVGSSITYYESARALAIKRESSCYPCSCSIRMGRIQGEFQMGLRVEFVSLVYGSNCIMFSLLVEMDEGTYRVDNAKYNMFEVLKLRDSRTSSTGLRRQTQNETE